MSKQIDERVVSMQFDNKQFEKNVQTSTNTLDKFKQMLDFKGLEKGFKNIDSAANKVDMSELSNSAETIGLKFNAMFSMADQALRNITNSAMAAGKRLVSALAIDPIKTGFQEYETQINSVQTILANTESKGSTLQDVNAALAELNTYADKTIYNFTEMTRNIGTFTAAGVDLKTSVAAIKGIANLAAVSGSTSQQASTAMYQLSQALSSGTVKLMDWNSVVNAGMGGQVFQDSLKETARVHGINIDAMIKKEGSFRETLQNGWLTSEILTETLAKFTGDLSEAQLKSMGYTDEQIEKIVKMGKTANDAATKVKTFTQLFDTLKEAAQSGWTKSWELLIGDFGEAKELLTDISDLIGGVIGDSADKRNTMLMGGLSTGWKQLLNEGIHDAAGFEEIVSNVAKEHGVDFASMIDDEHTFQDVLKQTLKDGKVTSDVLSESISKFTEKVSAMSGAELEAAGYTKDQVEKLKELNTNVQNGTVSMEEFTKLIMRPSGRELLIESLWNSIKGLQSVLTPIKQAFEEVFPATTGEQLYKLIEGFRDFTAKLTLSEEQAEKLKSVFKGAFSVISVGVNIIKSLVSGCVKLIGAILPIGDGLLDASASLGDFLTGLSDTIKSTAIIDGIFQGLADILKTVSTGIGSVLSSLAGGIDKCGGGIGMVQKLFDVIGQLFDKITAATPGNTIFDTFFELVNGGILIAIGTHLAKFMKGAKDAAEGIGDILGSVGEALDAFTGSIKAGTLQKIAISIGILSASLWVLSTIDPGRLTTSLIAIGLLFQGLMKSMSSFGSILEGNAFKGVGTATLAIIGISSALLILSTALKILSTITWQQMIVGLGGMIIGLQALVRSMKALPEGDVKKAAKALKTLASSLVIYSIAMKILSSIPWQEMIVGLGGMVGGLGALVGALHLMPKDISVKSGSLIGLATAMLILSGALKVMSTMTWDDIGRSLTTLAGSLIILVGAMHLMPSALLGASALLIISGALVVLSGALKILSTLSWEGLAIGLAGIAGALTIVAIAMNFMTTALPGALALVVVAGALAILTPVLVALGAMSWENIGKGLVALAGALTVIGIAGALLTPVIPSLLGLGAAIALLGAGCLAAGVGVLALGAGVTALAVAFTAAGATIIGAITSLINLIPTLASAIGTGIVSLVVAIGAGSVAIVDAVTKILTAVLQAIINVAPKLGETIIVLIDTILKVLVDSIPKMTDAGMKIIIGFLNGIANNMSQVVASAVRVVTEFLRAIGQETPKIVDAGFKMMIDFINGIADSCRENIPLITDAVGNVAEAIIDGLKEGLFGGIGGIGESFKSLATNGLDKFKEVLGIHSPSVVMNKQGHYIVQGLADGITKDMSAEEAAEKKAQNIVNAFKKIFDMSDIDSQIAKQDFDIWLATDGKYATEREKLMKQLDYQNDELARKIKVQNTYYDEWQETSKHLGSNSKAAKEAWKKYRDAQMEVLNIEEQIKETTKAKDNDTYYNEAAKRMQDRAEAQELWLETDGQYASEAVVNTRKIDDLKEDAVDIAKQIVVKEKAYNDAVKAYGENSEYSKAVLDEIEALKIEEAKTLNNIRALEENSTEIVKSIFDTKNDLIQTEYENWLATDGKYASDEVRDGKLLSVLEAQLDNTEGKYITTNQQLIDMKERALKQYKKDNGLADDWNCTATELNAIYAKILDNDEEYLNLVAEHLQNETDKANIEAQIANVAENRYQRQVEANERASDIADKEYQIWEATTGRNATSTEKDLMKMTMLNKQLYSQSEIVENSHRLWVKAESEYGKNTKEAQEAYSDYLSEQLNLAQIQNQITDINESTVERQRVALGDYKDYVKKYKKYYLENGMAMSDLEKDAKLVSGYDSNKTVNTMVSRTSEALESIKNSAEYAGLMDNFSTLGTSYVEAVNTGIKNETNSIIDALSEMVNACVASLKSKQAMWMDAGRTLAASFIQGIISELDSNPTIRPVLDLTNVESGVATLDSLFSRNQAISISNGMTGSSDGTSQNGNSASGGNTYQFTQNNYSPKALSRTEIYRQTNNQFTAMKEALT